jgi:protease-4
VEAAMKDRGILWVFLAFVLGFMLPVGSCVGAGVVTMGALTLLAQDGALPAASLGDAVAIIRLDGVITSDTSESFTARTVTPEDVGVLLGRAESDRDVKAVVVYVSSPGGSVVASDRIYHMLLDFEKPVVIWMGETAASGGYYIACGGDYIFAHPDTLTGSIGVISQFINAEELLDKIGVEAVVITSGARKDMGSLFRDMTEQERELWGAIIDEIHDSFVGIVAEARDLPLAEVRRLADGRVYTGRQALEEGLVDETGVLADAIAKAAELGGIEGEPAIIELAPEPTLIELLYGFQVRSAMPSLEEVLNWAGMPSLQFRLVSP